MCMRNAEKQKYSEPIPIIHEYQIDNSYKLVYVDFVGLFNVCNAMRSFESIYFDISNGETNMLRLFQSESRCKLWIFNKLAKHWVPFIPSHTLTFCILWILFGLHVTCFGISLFIYRLKSCCIYFFCVGYFVFIRSFLPLSNCFQQEPMYIIAVNAFWLSCFAIGTHKAHEMQ